MARDIFKDLRSECSCENVEYCPLEVLLESQSERTLEQHKLIEKFKYEKSREKGNDIGWAESYMRWCKEGYAKAFAEVYQDGMKYKELYNKVWGKMK